MVKQFERFSRQAATVALLLMIIASSAVGVTKDPGYHRPDRSGLAKTAATPNAQNCSHRVGNVWFTITNWGFFGSQFNQDQLTELYCLGTGIDRGSQAPSFEYPAGTGINYLFQGALWIGAIVGEDTLVSVGADGWQHINEMYPEEAPNGSIVQLSNRKTSEFYSESAISEQDFIAEYSDTLVDDTWTARDPSDNRQHKPLGIKIIQSSYSWSYSYAEDFILLDYRIVNIGDKDISKAYMALYVDADNWHPATTNGFQDDISGYRFAVPNPACANLDDSINIAWTADNDGDPDRNGLFSAISATAVAGTRVVRSPNPELKYSFNWWVSQGDATLDWGPRLAENNRNFGTGGLGTPEGDRNKYYIMSVREFDYDQIYSAVDHSAEGWLPPPQNIATDLANGYDTRYLFSFGPFDMSPGDTVPFTIGYVGGEGFHVKPDDFARYFNSSDPKTFDDRLDFSDFATNAQWAAWVYDNPGVDTDSNGTYGQRVLNPCSGESLYVSGDGVPDFQGPPPPAVPTLEHSSSPGSVTIRWNGHISEVDRDIFSGKVDFEGYRVYMGSKMQLNEFALLTSYDFANFSRHHLNQSYSPAKWEMTETPFTLEELKAIYGEDFDPDDYPDADHPKIVPPNPDDSTSITEYYYFTHQDYNRSHLGGPGEIKRVNPDASPTDSILVNAATNEWYFPFYDYEYTIDGLLPSRPVYMAVTTFDFGNPATSLAPLESSPLANAVEIYPVYSADVVADSAKKVTVFPNPYRIDGGYAEAGYEDPEAALSAERARRIHFANLPREATIRIYTLDGDLVRELKHPCDCQLQEGESMISWDLISRNTQAVVSGIYLYTVESQLGTQVGKFVIIK